MKDVQVGDVWITKKIYDDAEVSYYENASRAALSALTPLAEEVAKARQKLIESRDTFSLPKAQEKLGESRENISADVSNTTSFDEGAFKFIEKKVLGMEQTMNQLLEHVKNLNLRVLATEKLVGANKPLHEINLTQQPQIKKDHNKEDDDDVDLFASDSDEESAEAAKIREERLAAYTAKKSKKPVLIAKSNVILDVKPWDDETDMKLMEENVRKIEADGLLWGASKLVPLAFGIKKLQISCVVEDDKVSIDWLTEQIEAFEEYVQSVDIAAFNKI